MDSDDDDEIFIRFIDHDITSRELPKRDTMIPPWDSQNLFEALGLTEPEANDLLSAIFSSLYHADVEQEYFDGFYSHIPYHDSTYGEKEIRKREMETEAEKFRERVQIKSAKLGDIDLQWINVLGSGNCLFNSLVGAVKGLTETIPTDIKGHDEMRENIVNELDNISIERLIGQMGEMNIPTYKSYEEILSLYKDLLDEKPIDINSLINHMKHMDLLDESKLREKYKSILDEIDDIEMLKTVMVDCGLDKDSNITVIRNFYEQLLNNPLLYKEQPTEDEKKNIYDINKLIYKIKEKMVDRGLLNEYRTELMALYRPILNGIDVYTIIEHMKGVGLLEYSSDNPEEIIKTVYKHLIDIDMIKKYLEDMRIIDTESRQPDSELRDTYITYLDTGVIPETEIIQNLKVLLKNKFVDLLERINIDTIKTFMENKGLPSLPDEELKSIYKAFLNGISVEDMAFYMSGPFVGPDYSPHKPKEELRRKYKDIMGKETIWGGHIEIIAASKILGMPIIVISDAEDMPIRIFIQGEESDYRDDFPFHLYTEPIILGQTRNIHYMYARYDKSKWNRVHNITSDTGAEAVADAAVAVAEESATDAGVEEAGVGTDDYSSEDMEKFWQMQVDLNAVEDAEAVEQEFNEQKLEIDAILTVIETNVEIDIEYVIKALTAAPTQININPQLSGHEHLEELIGNQLKFEKVGAQMYIKTDKTNDKSLSYVISELNKFIESEGRSKEETIGEVKQKVTKIKELIEDFKAIEETGEKIYDMVEGIILDNIEEYVKQNNDKLQYGHNSSIDVLSKTLYELIFFIYTKIRTKIPKDIKLRKFPPLKGEELYYLYNIIKLLLDDNIYILIEKTGHGHRFSQKTLNNVVSYLKPIIFTKFKEKLYEQCKEYNIDFELIGVNLKRYGIDKIEILFLIYSYKHSDDKITDDIYNIVYFIVYGYIMFPNSTSIRELIDILFGNVKDNYLEELSETYQNLMKDYNLHSRFLENLIYVSRKDDVLRLNFLPDFQLRLDIIKGMNSENYSTDEFYAELQMKQEYPDTDLEDTDRGTQQVVYPTDREYEAVVYDEDKESSAGPQEEGNRPPAEPHEEDTEKSTFVYERTNITTLQEFLDVARINMDGLLQKLNENNVSLNDLRDITKEELEQIYGLTGFGPNRRFQRVAREMKQIIEGGKRTTRSKRTKTKTNKRRTNKRKTKKRKISKKKKKTRKKKNKKKKRSTKRKRR